MLGKYVVLKGSLTACRGALSTPVDIEHYNEEVTVVNHGCRLTPVGKHPQFDTTGIYRVKRSTKSNEETVVIWRIIMDNIDRVTVWEPLRS